MLDMMYILIFLFAMIMMFYAITKKIPYLALMDSMVWLFLAYFTLGGIEIQGMVYFPSSDTYNLSTVTIQNDVMGSLAYLWMLLGIIMIIFFVTFTLEYMYKPPKDMG